ncbi:hypothetical protein RFI_21333 [Reticulomyxa filosa]|uniref:Uncharacterized protein n=1 Tax=Reticulomyxa filosa TaxID=46433 RepID=X6MSE7_RETFI|nr:hypothetical protein RFI_21333 [Reticulomyxa filosa]|eukprot:ETO16025.1 hypothetical protein RFI_21333 [Reticulomyxa filosa]
MYVCNVSPKQTLCKIQKKEGYLLARIIFAKTIEKLFALKKKMVDTKKKKKKTHLFNTSTRWMKQNTNVVSLCNFTPILKKKKGAVVNIGSAGSVLPHELHEVYSGTKSYLNKWTIDMASAYQKTFQKILPSKLIFSKNGFFFLGYICNYLVLKICFQMKPNKQIKSPGSITLLCGVQHVQNS